jgi:glycine cleavage system H lipoate-binding protein
MPDFLETTVDKFTFRVATGRWYTAEGVWALPEDGSVRVGASDFLQQRSGDVAFVEVQPAGTPLAAGDGWLVVIDPAGWDAERAQLLDAPAYFALMKSQAEAEARS